MQFEVGAVVEGKVTGLTNFGAFVELPGGKTGMVHISEVAQNYVKEIRDYLQENQIVKVKIISVGEDGKIRLSMKGAQKSAETPGERRPAGRKPTGGDWQSKRNEGMSFEDMMSKFKQVSDEKISDLRRGTESKHGGFSRRSN